MQPGRTFVAMNSHGTPTASMIHNPDWQFPAAGCEAAVGDTVGAELVGQLVGVATVGRPVSRRLDDGWTALSAEERQSAAETMVGIDGNTVYALPHDRLRALLAWRQKVRRHGTFPKGGEEPAPIFGLARQDHVASHWVAADVDLTLGEADVAFVRLGYVF